MPSFTSPDIVAIAAIFATVLVSLIGGVSSVLTNRANNRARRSEIVLEKQMTAISELYSALSRLSKAQADLLGSLTEITEERAAASEYSSKAKMVAEGAINLHAVYSSSSMYLPSSIESSMREYLDDFQDVALQVIDMTNTDSILITPDSISRQYKALNKVLRQIKTFLEIK